MAQEQIGEIAQLLQNQHQLFLRKTKLLSGEHGLMFLPSPQ